MQAVTVCVSNRVECFKMNIVHCTNIYFKTKYLVKTAFLIITAILLSGCVAIEPRKFDNVEYNYAVKTTVSATRAINLCNNAEYREKFHGFLNDLNAATMALAEYERHIAHNSNTLPIANYLRKLTIDFTVRAGEYTPQYCVHKLSSIQGASRTFSRILSQATEYNFCDSTVWDRFIKYSDSFDRGLITQREFEELSNDLVALASLDNAGCSFDTREKLAVTIQTIATVLKSLP